MKYIIYGNAMDKLIRENKIRIERGDIIVTPLKEESPEVDSMEMNPCTEDVKSVEEDDTKDVDLYTDDKNIKSDDTKDVPEAEVKATAPVKKTTRRTKTTE